MGGTARFDGGSCNPIHPARGVLRVGERDHLDGCSTTAHARRKYSSNGHSPLLPVWRVTTKSRLGTKAMYCPPEPGLARASAGIPAPVRPPSPDKRAGNSQPWEKISGLSFQRISGVFTSCVGAAVSSTNHFGMTWLSFH